MAVWRDNPDLMARLIEAQNHPANEHIDIMTFAALCTSREELERHVAYYEQRAANYVPPRRRARKAA